MIIVLKPEAGDNQIAEIEQILLSKGLQAHISKGSSATIIGAVGDTTKLDTDYIRTKDYVEQVKRVSEPYKLANRKFHPQDTLIQVENLTVGAGHFHVMSGPCSVESEAQIEEVARSVKESGATFLRGGAFKPRTSPYAFQGLKADGLALLLHAKKLTGLPIVTEIMNLNHLDLFADVDVIQVGARNMQNFELLRELGHCKKPILLKRGLSATIEEFLMSAEYIMAGGNSNIIFCERGIRTFETMTRNTFDLSAIPLLKRRSHLPVIADPSHATGVRWMVGPMAKAAVAAGADGLMIETHNDPANALSDGAQSLDLPMFRDLMADLRRRVEFEDRVLG
ncbi:MAG: 3-deoxy-7-phosphoheptulonate synthase [Clostridiales bacterium]|nr:3-deoxy-7-phosphoheptulonate synthase [Clostridiales bacterium]